MLVATTVLMLGVVGGIVAAQLSSLRIGGVVVVPLWAIYTLRSLETFPVFVMAVIASYVSVWLVKRRLFWYGRHLFIVAVVSGAVVPVLVFQFLKFGLGPREFLSGIEFVGSVLPGIAAYNFHRLSLQERVTDAVLAFTLLFLLVMVGIGLVILVGLTSLWTVTPPVLLGSQSSIANAFGLVKVTVSASPLLSRELSLVLITLGMLLSEGARLRWNLRTGGVIVLPLVVLFAMRSVWLFGLYLLLSATAFAAIQLLHRWSLIYGRALLSMGVVVGSLGAIVLSPALPFASGLFPFFTGILGGVTAFNIHVVAPAERRATVLASAASLVVLSALARVFVSPRQNGLLYDVGLGHVVVGVVILGLAGRELYKLEAARPPALERELTPTKTDTPSGSETD